MSTGSDDQLDLSLQDGLDEKGLARRTVLGSAAKWAAVAPVMIALYDPKKAKASTSGTFGEF